ncbi:heterokaryon incompatibility protein-domain-containing protein [Chaetomium tenue]|uniref:Heterokaryon incompatibility protein-domain-containing protein n=1 Tax=Chaetomium tenue TaxID=1854479 RepID=A0ACB7P1F6_9PEZI|nr:heterokaryon incompatibility protein-domain-containing protein [Chaetomium globosum]
MPLCERCEAIDLAQILAKSIPPDSRSIAEGWVHSQTFAQLRASAGTCELCSILLGDANTKPLVRDDDCVYLLVFTRNSWPRVGSGSHPIPIGGITVEIGKKGGNVLHSVRRVEVWIDDSGACRLPAPAIDLTKAEEAPELPTRVIDVGSANPVRHPILVETQGRKDRYIALSHCWGPNPSSITKTERGASMQARLQGIPIQELSTNFRHAVEVTRALGYQYLWIDSLCIVQDDPHDWAVESAKMAEVYTRAALTIAAANSASADEGFLKPRAQRRTVTLPFRGAPGVISGYFTVAEPSPEDANELRDHFRVDVDGGPLAARGWTLQERLLARRTVFFGRDQLHWECRAARWSETTRMQPIQYLESSAPGLVALRHGLPMLGSVPNPTAQPDHDRRTRLLNDWYRVLGEFTRRALTNKQDKLPALSGIAKVISQALNNTPTFNTTYHAGLWAYDLPRALLWTTFAPDAGTGSPLPGPSWSWISRSAAIHPASEEPTAVTSLRGATPATWDVALAGSDPYGRVQRGTLTLTGYLKRVPRMEPIQPRETRAIGPHSYPLSDALLYDGQGQQIAAAVLDEPADVSVFAAAGAQAGVYAVPVRHVMAKGAVTGVVRGIEALLVQERGDGTFRRVGVASLAGSSANDARCKDAPFAQPFQVFFYDAPVEIRIT